MNMKEAPAAASLSKIPQICFKQQTSNRILHNAISMHANRDFFLLREFLRLGNPLNCGAWDKKLLKQYRVHKPSSLSYDTDMRSKKEQKHARKQKQGQM